MATEFREQWLERLLPHITLHFRKHLFTVPTNLRVSCGFPSKGALGRKKIRIGECWPTEATEDNYFHIFISPLLEDSIKVAGVLVHEVAHAVVGLEHKHKKPFIECAKAVGLTPKWTATGESPELVAVIEGWIKEVGPYPHGALKPNTLKKILSEKGRMLLMECKCGLKIRTTKKWIEAYGRTWPCPCGKKLKAANQENDDGDEDSVDEE